MNDNGTIKKLVFQVCANLDEATYCALIKEAEEERRKPAELVRILIIDHLRQKEEQEQKRK